MHAGKGKHEEQEDKERRKQDEKQKKKELKQQQELQEQLEKKKKKEMKQQKEQQELEEKRRRKEMKQQASSLHHRHCHLGGGGQELGRGKGKITGPWIWAKMLCCLIVKHPEAKNCDKMKLRTEFCCHVVNLPLRCLAWYKLHRIDFSINGSHLV